MSRRRSPRRRCAVCRTAGRATHVVVLPSVLFPAWSVRRKVCGEDGRRMAAVERDMVARGWARPWRVYRVRKVD